jgi:hypothetical protein
MNQLQLDAIRLWFDTYVRTYDDIDENGIKNILLKVEHTRKVCQVMDILTTCEGLSPEDTCIAAATALLHDVGRFPQYRRWRTFRDSDSDNHARLSVEVIRAEGVLDSLPPDERKLIEEAVRFHNLLEVPARLKSPSALFLKLIRDADKLDIWRVFLDYFQQAPEQRASAVSLGFPDLPAVSPICVDTLLSARVVHLDTVRSLNDFKLLQISWVYDLNFPASYRLLKARGYVEALASSLPQSAEIDRAIQRAVDMVELRAQG